MATKDSNGSSARIQLAVMANDLQYIKQELHDFREEQRSNYVTKEAFSPIQKIVYTLVGLILMAVVGSLINLVILK